MEPLLDSFKITMSNKGRQGNTLKIKSEIARFEKIP